MRATKSSSIRSRKLLAVTAATGLFIALTGCAADSPESSASEPLNVGQISDSIAFFPLHVAEEEGFFEEEGVTLGERPRLGTGAKLAAALTSNSIDVGAGVVTDAFNLAQSNPKTLITGSLVTEYYVDIIVGTDFSGPEATASLDEKIRALQGKNIGITGPGSGTEALVTYLFEQVGLDASKDATLVNLGAVTTSAIGALTSGQVDALSFFQPVGQTVVTQDQGSIYISPQRGDIPNLTDVLHGTMFSTTDALAAKGPQIESFNRAIDSALSFIIDEPGRSKALLQEYLAGTDAETIDALFELLPEELSESTKVEEDSFSRAVDFHIATGLISEAPKFSELVWEQARG